MKLPEGDTTCCALTTTGVQLAGFGDELRAVTIGLATAAAWAAGKWIVRYIERKLSPEPKVKR